MASSSEVEDVSSHLWLRGGRTTESVIIIISVRARTAKDWTGLIVPSLVSLVLLFIVLLLLEVLQTLLAPPKADSGAAFTLSAEPWTPLTPDPGDIINQRSETSEGRVSNASSSHMTFAVVITAAAVFHHRFYWIIQQASEHLSHLHKHQREAPGTFWKVLKETAQSNTTGTRALSSRTLQTGACLDGLAEVLGGEHALGPAQDGVLGRVVGVLLGRDLQHGGDGLHVRVDGVADHLSDELVDQDDADVTASQEAPAGEQEVSWWASRLRAGGQTFLFLLAAQMFRLGQQVTMATAWLGCRWTSQARRSSSLEGLLDLRDAGVLLHHQEVGPPVLVEFSDPAQQEARARVLVPDHSDQLPPTGHGFRRQTFTSERRKKALA